MSEKSKGVIGDTSSSILSSKIVKNPLLSASVTGLTFDDFQHKPLLLPAAPPIIQQTTTITGSALTLTSSPLIEESNLKKGDEQKLIGEIDNDTFSEINLNSPIDEDISLTSSGDNNNNNNNGNNNTNTNLQEEESNKIIEDSILSQAASSFSQLPTVASNVFSTFSKVIKDYSPNSNSSNNNQLVTDTKIGEYSSESNIPQLQTIPEPIQQTGFYTPLSNYPTHQSTYENQPIPEPPKFYSPIEIIQTNIVNPPVGPPPTSGQQNTYRLSAKKKTYAQIPGITSAYTSTGIPPTNQQFQSTTPTSSSTQNQFNFLPNRSESTEFVSENSNLTEKPSEERKGLFSFTSFVPPVLQNLTGLVQTSSKQSTENTENNILNQNFEPVNFPYIEDQNQSSSISVVPQFYNPTNLAKSVSPPPNLFSQENNRPSLTPHIFSPGSVQQQQQGDSHNFVNTTGAAIAAFPPPPPLQSTVTTVDSFNSRRKSTTNSEYNQNPEQQPQLYTPQIPSTQNLTNISQFQTTTTSNIPVQQFVPPLEQQPLIPKPPANTGSNTFRLQKGTRLYKSPFTSGNIFNTPATSDLDGFASSISQPATKTVLSPPAIFNPFQQVSQNIEKSEQQTSSFVVPNSTPTFLPLSDEKNIISPPPSVNSKNLSAEHLTQSNFTPLPSQIFNSFQQPLQKKDTNEQELLPPPVAQIIPEVSLHTENKTQPASVLLPSKIFDSVEELSQKNELKQKELPLIIPSADLEIVPISATTQNNLNLRSSGGDSSLISNKDSEEFKLQNTPVLSAPTVGIDQLGIEKPAVEETIQSSFSNQSENFKPVQVEQHINPFEPTSISTPVAQLSPAEIANDNIDTPTQVKELDQRNENFETTNTKLPLQISKTINNNNPTDPIQNQPPTYNLLNYFSNQANNNLPEPQQQQQFVPFSFSNQNTTPTVTSPVNNTVPLQVAPISNYFSIGQAVNNTTNNFQQQQEKPQEKISTPVSVLTPPPPLPSVLQVPPPSSLPDPLSFFDSFNNSTTQTTVSSSLENSFNNNNNNSDVSEDPNSLRIQNFFNNPPQNNSDSVSELNYRLVGSSVLNKRLDNLIVNHNEDTRTVSSLSNVAEPPSSSCSEFSSDFSQQQLQQQNQQQQQQQQQLQQQQPIVEHQEQTTGLLAYLSKLSHDELPDEIIEKLKMSNLSEENSKLSLTKMAYRPVTKHWFYNKHSLDKKPHWMPFSQRDSNILEENYLSPTGEEIVAVEGGRYDVNIKERKRNAVYWITDPTEVRRCSWFYKSVDSKYVPYEEEVAEKLEDEYKQATVSGEWRRKVSLPSGENVTFHGPSVMVHFHHPQGTDSWGGTSTATPGRPRVVKRDVEDFNIEPGETSKVDHLLLMVHGIGSACDLKFRSVEEVVDEFRSIATQLVQSHYKTSYDNGDVQRVEVLPVSWHSELHSKESGIDERLKAITLESIPKLRNFTNDTLVDILFYTSPVFCQNIINTVCTAMNSIYMKYCQRNPEFKGGVSLAGHSLGSLILFDLLCHQNSVDNVELQNSENPDQVVQPLTTTDQNNHTEQISYTVGSAGTGQPFISYPQLIFQAKKFFALGSPIGMFVTIRGIDKLGLNFKLPTCPGFYNIFHPYDPVAYRLEALINPDLSNVRPVLIPHHKGRKRMHLELKETMTRISADLKQKVVDTFKNTFDSVYFLTTKTKQTDPQEIQKEVDKVLDEQLKVNENNIRSRSTSMSSDLDVSEIDLPLGMLNNSKRIDYVLQEAPVEFFNEYLFALTSHVCYWESEDTILFIMKEIYSSIGINSDSQIPQQSMTIERPSSRKGSSNDP